MKRGRALLEGQPPADGFRPGFATCADIHDGVQGESGPLRRDLRWDRQTLLSCGLNPGAEDYRLRPPTLRRATDGALPTPENY